MDYGDKTPVNNYIGINPELGLSGLEQHEAAVDFFKKIGLSIEEIAQIPEIAMSSIGSLISQTETQQQDIAILTKAFRNERKIEKRLREQRDQLRAMFVKLGHDPMRGYQSQDVEFTLR